MTARRIAVAAVPAIFLAAPGPAARAQPDRPFVVPQRDVDVLYAIPAPNGRSTAAAQRMRFAADPERQRVDPPGSGTYMITDYAAHRLTVVQPALHRATVLPAPGAPIAPHGVRATAGYRRLGGRVVAGAACTDWSTQDQSGAESVICLTDDGVMLQASQGGRLLLQAVSLVYAPLPDALFAVPDGYQTDAPPAR